MCLYLIIIYWNAKQQSIVIFAKDDEFEIGDYADDPDPNVVELNYDIQRRHRLYKL